ncbi:MAG: PIN domain-containing protein [Methanothrix sp.]|nr:PIN domain-containing protein [Methanothrix sp.]MCX8208008.1 PIN domain-containing protein [Methanothrix sp.]
MSLIGSEAVDLEVSLTPDERRQKVMPLAELAESKVVVSDRVASRARELEALGFDVFDALHIACAEGYAEVLLTTDDRFLSKAAKHADKIKVRVRNSVLWLMELLE